MPRHDATLLLSWTHLLCTDIKGVSDSQSELSSAVTEKLLKVSRRPFFQKLILPLKGFCCAALQLHSFAFGKFEGSCLVKGEYHSVDLFSDVLCHGDLLSCFKAASWHCSL